ncbi:MAG: sensor histidine kinase [Clostridium paraputrificum]
MYRIGGGVKVSLQEEKDLIKIVIEDSGIGIGEDEIFKVFKRFYRGRDINVQRQEGSGLGLYLSRRIIEEEGGTIGLNSEVGKGSIFTITFYKGLLE